MKFSTFWRSNAVIVLLLAVIALVACFYQTQKVGFHEDEVFTIASAVNPGNGLLTAYEDNLMPEHGTPVWKTSQEVREFVTLTPDNYFNFHSIYRNQELDNHPPLFYILVHFSALLLGGQFSKYTVFLINLPALLASGAVGEAVMAAGYFLYEAAPFPVGLGLGALANVPFNLVQGVFGLVSAGAVYLALFRTRALARL